MTYQPTQAFGLPGTPVAPVSTQAYGLQSTAMAPITTQPIGLPTETAQTADYGDQVLLQELARHQIIHSGWINTLLAPNPYCICATFLLSVRHALSSLDYNDNIRLKDQIDDLVATGVIYCGHHKVVMPACSQ